MGYTCGVNARELTDRAKQLALEVGFARVGVAPASSLPPEPKRRLLEWVRGDHCAGMAYLRRNQSLRTDPSLLVPGARSVLCLAVSYAPPRETSHDRPPRIARYARGRDYHKVLKKMGRQLIDALGDLEPGFSGRCFTDSAPVMERSLAVLAGLGWIGRNGCLIVPTLGSFVLLAEVISNLPLIPDSPIYADCGACRRCLESCPTGALMGQGLVAAERCISYWNKGTWKRMPEAIGRNMRGWICGCDACQEVCPHNRDLPAGHEAFLARDEPPVPLDRMLAWSREEYTEFTRGRALGVVSYDQMLLNLICAAGQAADPSLEPPLKKLLRRRPDLSGWIRWAKGRCRERRG
jgi:epoxyqueuosine reductase